MLKHFQHSNLSMIILLMIIGTAHHPLGTERVNNQIIEKRTSSTWLTHIQETVAATGTLLARDASGTPVILEWHLVDGKSRQLSERIKDLSEILTDSYTQQEMQFMRKYPDAVPQEYFLKPLAPLFKDGIAEVNWSLVEEQMRVIFQRFFMTTDFASFSTTHELHVIVIARDKGTEAQLGCIQFMITQEYAYETVKATLSGVMPAAHDRGLEKLLMSSIFKLIPSTKRVFLHTRITNELALNAYRAWGFTQFPGPLAYWIDLEHLAAQSAILQHTAQTFIS